MSSVTVNTNGQTLVVYSSSAAVYGSQANAAAATSALTLPATISSSTTYYYPDATQASVTLVVKQADGTTLFDTPIQVGGGAGPSVLNPRPDAFQVAADTNPASYAGKVAGSCDGPTGDLVWPTANRAIYTPFQVDSATVVDLAEIYVGIQSGNIDVGVYADSSGAPGARLVSTGSMTTPGATRAAIALTAVTLAPGKYHFALACDNTTASFGNNPRSGYVRNGGYKAASFPLPDPAGSVTALGNAIAFRVGKS